MTMMPSASSMRNDGFGPSGAWAGAASAGTGSAADLTPPRALAGCDRFSAVQTGEWCDGGAHDPIATDGRPMPSSGQRAPGAIAKR